MTETTTEAEDPLLAFVLAILTPLLMIGGVADASRAARQAIAEYRAAGQDHLISIAQIVGFAVASLDNLRLSAAADLSVSMKLKLRGNANALNGSAQRSTAALQAQRGESRPRPDAGDTEAKALASLEQARIEQLPPLPAKPRPPEPVIDSQQDQKRIWAEAMIKIAAECSGNLDKLSPARRRAEAIRIGALSETARHLNQGGAIPSKSGLFTSTALGALQPALSQSGQCPITK